MRPTARSKTERTSGAPYVGPRSFRRGEKLYGRDQEIFELTNRLLANHVVLLHALSGAGKTSMINAGLITNLETQGFRVLPVVRVKEEVDPARMPSGLTWNRYKLSTLLSLEKDRPEKERLPTLKLASLSLATYLARRQPRGKKSVQGGTRTLLIFDQFEEILNLNPADIQEKKDYLAWLMPVLYDTRYWALFSIRDDFVGGLEPYLGYFPSRMTARYRLEFLGDQAAYQAIVMPAKNWREEVTFEKEAADELVKELRKVIVQDISGDHEEQGPYIEPIQLQVVCLKLWENPRPDPTKITLEDVKKSGSVDRALADYYNKILNDIASDDEHLQRNLRNWIERQLITQEGFRSQSLQRHLVQYGLNQENINGLVGAYLVRPEQRLNATWYELAHDRLVRPIVQANQRWREDNLLGWQLTAERWERDGKHDDSDLLLKRQALIESQAGYNPSRSAKIDVEFLQASEKTIARAREIEIQSWADPERLRRVELGTNLDETGWGVIFHQNAPSELKEALKELLDLRQVQASAKRPVFYRIFEGPNGYRPGETAEQFLRRNGATSGIANPEKLPYYLLIVGDPVSIPFEFQYGLDQQYAVGRIYFETLAEYQSYARSVRVCEVGTVRLPNRAALFSPEFPGNKEMETLEAQLIRPLLYGLGKAQPNWRIDSISGQTANKESLASLMGGLETPALLLVATHSLVPMLDKSEQNSLAGAMLCAGAPLSSPPQPEYTFAAADVPDEARLLGLVAFLVSGYTAGAPAASDFAFRTSTKKLAERAFLARLPQRLLGHPRGGALAVIAHVDELWLTSFSDEGGASEVGIYQDLFVRLMQSYTAGAAMELLNQRYTLLNTILQERLLSAYLSRKGFDDKSDRQIKADMTRALDARNYLLIGDPAARLPVDPAQEYQDPDPDWIRPAITAVTPLVSKTAPAPPPPPLVETPTQEIGALWFSNGLQAAHGEYDLPPLTSAQIIELLKRANLRDGLSQSLRSRR